MCVCVCVCVCVNTYSMWESSAYFILLLDGKGEMYNQPTTTTVLKDRDEVAPYLFLSETFEPFSGTMRFIVEIQLTCA